MTGLKMTLALIVLIGFLILFKRYIGGLGTARTGKGTKPIRVVSVCHISLKQHVALVQIPGAILVLGITPDRMTVLSRITDSELIEQVLTTGASPDGLIFSNVLTKFRREAS
ncbi:MAG: flagellar biosynthetic protein FliO [Desulfatirhabdiaceae bacterium]